MALRGLLTPVAGAAQRYGSDTLTVPVAPNPYASGQAPQIRSADTVVVPPMSVAGPSAPAQRQVVVPAASSAGDRPSSMFINTAAAIDGTEPANGWEAFASGFVNSRAASEQQALEAFEKAQTDAKERELRTQSAQIYRQQYPGDEQTARLLEIGGITNEQAWARGDANRQRAEPDWKTFEEGGNVYRYDANDPDSRPEIFFDTPDQPSDNVRAANDRAALADQYELTGAARQNFILTGDMPSGASGQDLPADVVEYNIYRDEEVAAGRTPMNRIEYAQAMRGGGSNGTTITMDENGRPVVQVGGSAKYGQVEDTGLAELSVRINNDAVNSIGTLDVLDAMEQQMADPSFYSGFGAPQLQTLKQLGAALGVDPDGVTSMETFNSLTSQAVLRQMGGSLGTGISNADRDFIESQVPNLENTPEGNQQIIDITRKTAQRQIEISQLAREYAAQNNGQLDTGFTQELQEFAEANPLFGASEAQPGEEVYYNPETGERRVFRDGVYVRVQ